MLQLSRDNEVRFFYIVLVVSIPVFLLNLGEVPFLEDEGIRALVALEMDLSDHYVAPTLNGEPYYKKPPLWNWILLASFKLFGQQNEFAARFPMVICLYGFCLSIFLVVKRHVGKHEAILTTIMFLTCGRILFWDSLLAFIDIAFSWVIFLMLSWIYKYLHREQYLWCFVGAYLFAAIAFLLKALPALVFLGFSLLAIFLYHRKGRKLISSQHVAGMATLILVLGIYLWFYTRHQNPESLMAVFLDESTQRTFVEYGFFQTLIQIISFPFEMIYHFLPWSLIVVLVFRKNVRTTLLGQPFIAFSLLIFAANIWVYWTAPEVYPRYLFPLAPFYFLMGIFLYNQQTDHWSRKVFEVLCYLIAIGVGLGSSLVLFSDDVQIVPNLSLKWIAVFIIMGGAVFLMFRYRHWQLHWFCIFLLAARLGFDLIVLPSRSVHSSIVPIREDAVRIGTLTRNHHLAIYQSDTMRFDASFYLTRERQQIVPIVKKLPSDGFLLVNPRIYHTLEGKFAIRDSLRVPRPEKHIFLVEINGNER